MADAGGDKYFFNARYLAKILKQANLPCVITFKRRTDLWIQTSFARAGASTLFPRAVDAVHIRRRAADVHKIAFKIGKRRYLSGFGQDGGFATTENGAALM